jgi:hypothetical protein
MRTASPAPLAVLRNGIAVLCTELRDFVKGATVTSR